jgi:hypothetical protein
MGMVEGGGIFLEAWSALYFSRKKRSQRKTISFKETPITY